VEADTNYEEDEDGDTSKDESNGNEDVPDLTMEDEEPDVYTVDDEWGTLVTEESKGIFKPVIDAIAKRTPKILHVFAYTAYICSVLPDIVQDAKRRLEGNGAVRNKIENCVRRLLSHDIDGAVEGSIDIKVDQFWDELNHFQNW
jgi:hypothetical protein